MIDFDQLVLAPALATFGELVTYIAGDGTTSSLPAIWDEKQTETRFDRDGVEVTSQRPSLALRVSSIGFGRPTESEIFQIRGRTYRVSDPPIFDGQGHVRVPLQLATDADALSPPAAPVPVPAALT